MANEAPGGGSPALRKQLGVLSRFLHSFELAKLNPDCTLVQRRPAWCPECSAIPEKPTRCTSRAAAPRR